MISAKQPTDDAILVRGARQNNLKGIDCDIPLNRLTVITAVTDCAPCALLFWPAASAAPVSSAD